MPVLDDIETFAKLLTESGAEVVRCDPGTLSQTVIGLIAQKGWDRVVSVRRNRVGHPSVFGDDPPLTEEQLATMDAVITEARSGIADRGLVVLDHGPGQGRRGLTLIPATHVCVVGTASIQPSTTDLDLTVDGPLTVLTGPSGFKANGFPVHCAQSLIVVLVTD